MPADLYRRLSNLDGKSYGAYKSLRGSHDLPDLDATLFIDKVQSDPYRPGIAGPCPYSAVRTGLSRRLPVTAQQVQHGGARFAEPPSRARFEEVWSRAIH